MLPYPGRFMILAIEPPHNSRHGLPVRNGHKQTCTNQQRIGGKPIVRQELHQSALGDCLLSDG